VEQKGATDYLPVGCDEQTEFTLEKKGTRRQFFGRRKKGRLQASTAIVRPASADGDRHVPGTVFLDKLIGSKQAGRHQF
jgi:hypothetical protein